MEIERFVVEFFESLNAQITREGDSYIVSNVPVDFEKYIGRKCPYKISFKPGVEFAEYVSKDSHFFSAITGYLKESAKTTLLKIDFEVEPLKEIRKSIDIKNCKISNVLKKHKNCFFSRFTFLTTFRFLNESQSVVNEIYVHNGRVVSGDLKGYRVVEGKSSEVSADHLEKDYHAARDKLRELLEPKVSEIKEKLEKKLEREITRIKEHYKTQLLELGGDLNARLEKIKELEIKLHKVEGEEAEKIRGKLERLRKGLVKIGSDVSKERILKEQEFTIRDAVHKHSLNIDNDLINTAVIYYPVFLFNLLLRKDESVRSLELSYDPLLERIDGLLCESCGRETNRLNLCALGHVSCDNCIGHCGECSKEFCSSCLRKSCNSCGKPLCQRCAVTCQRCRSTACQNHMRTDCTTGEERCVRCLRACLRCHGLSEPKYFGESLDGSKVCQKCLAKERGRKIVKEIFKD
ncbi:hypothetical protein D6829_01015 [Candidatus Pacearchaeota archaeon]|nr:MAG: hypothetical protein D6829_01015 [Candidatus Pacearchaeota archaeon]